MSFPTPEGLIAFKEALKYSALQWHKRSVAPTAGGEFDAKKQTAEHVTTSCLIHHHSNGARALSFVDKSLLLWLAGACSAI